MLYRLTADFLVALHFLFIVFVLFGGLAVLKWPRLAFLHIPAVIWGILIEFSGWFCPLTDYENNFRKLSGAAGYPESFIEHYLLPIIYPAGLTRQIQIILGIIVLLINGSIYLYLFKKRKFYQVNNPR